MSWSLSEIQSQISSELGLSSTPASEGSTEWNQRLSFINRAQVDLQEAYDWRWLLKTVNTQTSLATGNVTVTLPLDFRKLATSPLITWDGTTTDSFPEVDLVEVNKYVSTDRFVTVIGNPRDNYSFVVHAGDLTSGASINYRYYSSMPSLASAINITAAPDPTYVVQKATAYLYRAAGDNRFQDAFSRADQTLARLIEKESVRGDNFDDRVKTRLETRNNFRIGRN